MKPESKREQTEESASPSTECGELANEIDQAEGSEGSKGEVMGGGKWEVKGTDR